MPSFEDIKNAVFYAHEKPELLANIINELVNGGAEAASTEEQG